MFHILLVIRHRSSPSYGSLQDVHTTTFAARAPSPSISNILIESLILIDVYASILHKLIKVSILKLGTTSHRS